MGYMHVETLPAPSKMTLGGGSQLRRVELSCVGLAPSGRAKGCLCPSLHHARAQQEESHLQTGKQAPTHHRTCGASIMDSPPAEL